MLAALAPTVVPHNHFYLVLRMVFHDLDNACYDVGRLSAETVFCVPFASQCDPLFLNHEVSPLRDTICLEANILRPVCIQVCLCLHLL